MPLYFYLTSHAPLSYQTPVNFGKKMIETSSTNCAKRNANISPYFADLPSAFLKDLHKLKFDSYHLKIHLVSIKATAFMNSFFPSLVSKSGLPFVNVVLPENPHNKYFFSSAIW